jgi:hypothetical protein
MLYFCLCFGASMSRNVRGIGVALPCLSVAVRSCCMLECIIKPIDLIKHPLTEQSQQLPHVDPQNVLVQSTHPLHPASWETTSDRSTFRSQPRCRTRFLRVETDRGERLLGRFYSECRRTYRGEGDGGKAVEPATGRRSRYDPMYRVERESAFSDVTISGSRLSSSLNQYIKHAKEVNMPIPEVPTVFM